MSLVVICGPPAVGKMTVGLELQPLTGLRLFHNHMTIDLALNFFAWGTPPFRRLVGEFRRRICEEVAASELPGMIFTYVWAFDHPGDAAFIDELRALFAAHGRETHIAELQATQAERLRRNETELRLAEKRPKRDLVRSRVRLLEDDATYQLDSRGEPPFPERWLRIDNTALAPDEVARRIAAHFALPAAGTE